MVSGIGNKVKVNCCICNKEFLKNKYYIDKNKYFFCSRECYKIGRSTIFIGKNAGNYKGGKITTNCVFCNKIIFVPKHAVKESGNYCSPHCLHQHFKIKYVGVGGSNWRGGKKSLKCDNCGKIIYRTKCRIFANNFCSIKCRGEWCSNNKIGVNNPCYKRIETKCFYCGKIIYVKPFRLKNNKTLYCSFKCANKGYGLIYRGDKHPNWLGGSSLNGYTLDWTDLLREKIRYRDENKCQICGVHETNSKRKLSVHHIDYDKKNLNEKNLITLCTSCHTKTNFNREIWKDKFLEIMEKK